MSPINGADVLDNEPLRLSFRNASSTGERPVWYLVELAADRQFDQKLFTRVKVPPGDSTTTVVPDVKLAAEATYYWRVKAEDGANASEYSPAAHFTVVAPVVIHAPAPRAPIGGQTTATNRPELVVENGRVEGNAGEVYYHFQVASDPAFTGVIAHAEVPRQAGERTTYTPPSLPSGTLFFWRARGTNGTVTSAHSAVESFRTPSFVPPPTPPPPPSGGVPGCVNGVLADPKAYFFALIGRKEGDPANDWVEVMLRSGIPGGWDAGHRPGIPLPPGAVHYGLTQQIDSGGTPRGRIHLPASEGNHDNWYFQDVDILDSPSGPFRWGWRPQGWPPYAPRPCQ